MADTYEKDLAQKTSLTTSDYIRVVGSDNVSYKQLVSDVAKKIIENYTGSSLGGSAQSVKTAVDALNARTVTVSGSDYSAFRTAYSASSSGLHFFSLSGTVASTLTGGRVTASIRGFFDRGSNDFVFSDGNGQLYTMRLSALGETAPTITAIRKATMTSIS